MSNHIEHDPTIGGFRADLRDLSGMPWNLPDIASQGRLGSTPDAT